MARSRLGLVAVLGSYAGPWIMANGAKRVVAMVRGLAPEATLKVVSDSGETQTLYDGPNIVHIHGWQMYRVEKVCDDGAAIDSDKPTTVEFVYDCGCH